jgi:hypothetical protein
VIELEDLNEATLAFDKLNFFEQIKSEGKIKEDSEPKDGDTPTAEDDFFDKMVLFENKQSGEAGKKRKETLSDQHKVNQETFGPMTFSQSVHGGGRHQNLRNNGRGGQHNRGQRNNAGGRGGYQNSRSNQSNPNNASATSSTPVSNASTATPQTD